MTNAQYYRDEAERCRRLALSNPESVAAPRWRRSAQEYELLAQSMEFRCAAPPQRRNAAPALPQYRDPDKHADEQV
jgi:hypothetical protein